MSMRSILEGDPIYLALETARVVLLTDAHLPIETWRPVNSQLEEALAHRIGELAERVAMEPPAVRPGPDLPRILPMVAILDSILADDGTAAPGCEPAGPEVVDGAARVRELAIGGAP